MKAALILLLALSGCAGLPSVEQIGTPDNFAKCAAADVVTTTIGLSVGGMVEGNPLTRALTIKAFGHVAGTVVPVIGLSVAGYYLLKWINRPAVTATATALTCFSAARNLYISRGAM